MKKLVLLIFLIIPPAFGMQKRSWFSWARTLNPLKTVQNSRFYGFGARSYGTSLLSTRFSKIFSSNRLLSSLYCNGYNQENNPFGFLIPVLIMGTAVYKSSSWNKSLYADEKQESDEELSVEKIVSDYTHNAENFITMLRNNATAAGNYAEFIVAHFDEFLNDVGASLIVRLLNDNKLKIKKILIDALEKYSREHFITMIIHKPGITLLNFYCNDLRNNSDNKESEGLFEKQMAVFADLFLHSITDIISMLPNRCLSDFLYKIVPFFEPHLFKNYKNEMKKVFTQQCPQLVKACNIQDSYSLYAMIKLFIHNNEEHEKIFVDELFKRFNELDDFYYLTIVKTKKGQELAIANCIERLSATCSKHELIQQLCYWIHCDASLAKPFCSEQSLKILLSTTHGHLLLQHLIRANPSIQNLVDKIKNSLDS